ncbi:MAG: DUF4838 domain-containing protein [Clostridia bacterium]|nr:DUF4838 domain-containing protein [Clostridia bacterium]
MKKLLSTFLAILTAIAAAPLASAATESFAVGQSAIVVAQNASQTDKYAAERLKYYLDKITGKDIAIITDNDGADAEICVGATNRTDADLADKAEGSYIITSSSERVIINGTGNKGTINGVYAFLEKYCGCHWYEAEVIVIPENSALSVPADINEGYTPYFEYTETDTASSRDIEFSLANGLTGGVYRSFTAEQGSQVGYIGRFAHTMTTLFCKAEEYFDEHPEYFSLRDGKRVPEQLCLTNDDVKDIVTAEVLALLEEQHNPEADIQIISLTQHDNFLYCQCDKCKALDEENGSQSGTMITFVNEIARRVKAHGGYDNVVFDTFAYQYTRKAPTRVVPREDVIVRLCSIECCFGHTLDDESCELNVDFMNDLKEWKKICNRIYIWDYVNNYRETVCIFPNFGVLQRNVQIFAENNVKGVYEEGNYYIDECDAEFAEMRTYLLSKLMQNPYIDYSAEMDGYLNAVYGAGGCYIREFIDIMTEHAVTADKHLSIYQESTKTLYNMSKKDIEYCNGLWAKAEAAATTDEQLQQVRRSGLSWRYWQCMNKCGEFSRWQFPYVYMNAGERLHHDLKEMGITMFGEGGHVELSDCELLYYFRPANKWTMIFEEWFWDVLNPFAVAIYKVTGFIYKLFN